MPIGTNLLDSRFDMAFHNDEETLSRVRKVLPQAIYYTRVVDYTLCLVPMKQPKPRKNEDEEDDLGVYLVPLEQVKSAEDIIYGKRYSHYLIEGKIYDSIYTNKFEYFFTESFDKRMSEPIIIEEVEFKKVDNQMNIFDFI